MTNLGAVDPHRISRVDSHRKHGRRFFGAAGRIDEAGPNCVGTRWHARSVEGGLRNRVVTRIKVEVDHVADSGLYAVRAVDEAILTDIDIDGVGESEWCGHQAKSGDGESGIAHLVGQVG